MSTHNSDKVANILIQKGAKIDPEVNGKRDTTFTLLLRRTATRSPTSLSKKALKLTLKIRIKRTPLHFAAQKNSDKVANILIQKGAKIDAEDNDKWIPLHFAAWKNSDKVANLLIDRGAKIHAVEKK